MESITLDAIDLQLLDLLQHDAAQSNQALAERVHVSPPTCLRRVKRLHDVGLIERQVALLQPDRLAAVQGHGLACLGEVSLDRQSAEALDAFEARAVADAVPVPVIASGGVGALQHLSEGIRLGGADAVLAASIFHYGEFTVAEAKACMAARGIPVRV